jgi:hypothetical protein
MDFKEKKCWVDKSAGLNIPFEAMEINQAACESDPHELCWYAIDSYDLIRIHKTISEK